MKIYSIIIGIFSLIVGCNNAVAGASSEDQKALIGVWQDLNFMASGWKDVFQFFDDGSFIFNHNQMDCGKRETSYSGKYEVKGNTLTLKIYSRNVIEGGKLVEATGSCASDFDIDDGKLATKSINPPETKVLKLSKPAQDKGVNRFGEPYEKMKISIDQIPYWKFYDDPSKYQD